MTHVQGTKKTVVSGAGQTKGIVIEDDRETEESGFSSKGKRTPLVDFREVT